MLDLTILEQNPIFILDTNSLNKFPLSLLEVFDFYLPQGVVKEVERWTSLLESLPQKIAEKEKEIEEESQVTKAGGWLEGFKEREEYGDVNNLLDELFLEEKTRELGSKNRLQEWEEAIKLEYQRISDDFDRKRRDYNLEFVTGLVTYALISGRRIKVEAKDESSDLFEEYLGGRGDLKFISFWCRKVAESLISKWKRERTSFM